MMPVPSAITDLSTTAASNSPAGNESARGTIDDYFRAHAKFIAELRTGAVATTANVTAGTIDGAVIGGSTPAAVSGTKFIPTGGAATGNGMFLPATNAVGISTNGVERHRIASDGAQSSVIPGGSTLLPEFKCRAWVNFNGTGTVAIRGSGNVSSVADYGVGEYGPTFTTAMPDVNWSLTVSCALNPGIFSNPDGTASAYIATYDGAAFADDEQVCVAAFR
jgi:hypothetical protein